MQLHTIGSAVWFIYKELKGLSSQAMALFDPLKGPKGSCCRLDKFSKIFYQRGNLFVEMFHYFINSECIDDCIWLSHWWPEAIWGLSTNIQITTQGLRAQSPARVRCNSRVLQTCCNPPFHNGFFGPMMFASLLFIIAVILLLFQLLSLLCHASYSACPSLFHTCLKGFVFYFEKWLIPPTLEVVWPIGTNLERIQRWCNFLHVPCRGNS